MAPNEAPAERLLRWAREPLLHFTLLGVGVFAVDTALAPNVADERMIVVSSERRDELSQRFAEARGRPPTADELGGLVEDWIVQEMLYREGLALGMDRDDVVIRNQVVRKMAYFYRSLAEVEIPDDARLRDYLDDNRDRYAQPARYDFVHIFVPKDQPDAKAQIEALQARAEGGADPHRLGVRFSKGRRFRRRTIEAITKTFDDGFAKTVTRAPVDRWVLTESRHGWHAVRVNRRHEARPADFGQLREQVTADYAREREQAYAREAVEELRENYRVREEPTDAP